MRQGATCWSPSTAGWDRRRGKNNSAISISGELQRSGSVGSMHATFWEEAGKHAIHIYIWANVKDAVVIGTLGEKTCCDLPNYTSLS